MNITALIDNDYKSLHNYFTKLFDVLQESIVMDKATVPELQDNDADESLAKYHSFSHLIKPGMIISIYSFMDFWMKEICNFQKRNNNLELDHHHKSFKDNHDLDTYHKYLTQYVGLNLDDVKDSYANLNHLRKVRNKFIHGGGHLRNDNKEKEFSDIPGIKVFFSMIYIENDFIFDMLEHAKIYLFAAAKTK